MYFLSFVHSLAELTTYLEIYQTRCCSQACFQVTIQLRLMIESMSMDVRSIDWSISIEGQT